MEYTFPDALAGSINQNVKLSASNEALRLARLCQSPIEVTFGVAVLMDVRLFQHCPIFIFSRGIDAHHQATEETLCDLYPSYFYLKPQYQIGRHRVDFIVGHAQVESEAVVELDGREFHYSTREQIERDRARDRELEAADYKVFRFPGTEVHHNPVDCARQVINWIALCIRGRS